MCAREGESKRRGHLPKGHSQRENRTKMLRGTRESDAEEEAGGGEKGPPQLLSVCVFSVKVRAYKKRKGEKAQVEIMFTRPDI